MYMCAPAATAREGSLRYGWAVHQYITPAADPAWHHLGVVISDTKLLAMVPPAPSPFPLLPPFLGAWPHLGVVISETKLAMATGASSSAWSAAFCVPFHT